MAKFSRLRFTVAGQSYHVPRFSVPIKKGQHGLFRDKFPYSSTCIETYVVTTHKNRLGETVLIEEVVVVGGGGGGGGGGITYLFDA